MKYLPLILLTLCTAALLKAAWWSYDKDTQRNWTYASIVLFVGLMGSLALVVQR